MLLTLGAKQANVLFNHMASLPLLSQSGLIQFAEAPCIISILSAQGILFIHFECLLCAPKVCDLLFERSVANGDVDLRLRLQTRVWFLWV